MQKSVVTCRGFGASADYTRGAGISLSPAGRQYKMQPFADDF
ncbi:MAG: hypothetical protein JWN94_4320 [Betaproteobacteria bacterium]|nr:hypothetical protein [Betaproteobacteria bacterium]